MNKSKNPSQCTGNILLAMFGSEILQASTITGRVSNKTKSKGQPKEKYAQLDPTLLAACKGIFS